MAELNLTATDSRQQTVLQHLIPMVSDTLAEKINNGVYIEKNGKRLLSKKDLSTFMAYAEEQAKATIAEKDRKGAQAVCVHGDDIMSWAIHYFEEDSIEGKLYNEDGTEYQPPKPVVKNKTVTATPVVKVEPPKPKQQQASPFDMLDLAENKTVTEQTDDHELVDNADDGNEQPTSEEIQEILAEVDGQEKREQSEPKKPSPMYQQYLNIQAKYPDSIIAYRLGDFYEVFGDNAVKIAKELDLTLTGRDCGLSERIPMIGFPFRAAETYISKIIQHGHKIAVAEDLDTVRELTADIAEQVIDTETGEVLSSGVQDDDAEDILAREREIAKAFDKEALIKLSDLLGNIFTLR